MNDDNIAKAAIAAAMMPEPTPEGRACWLEDRTNARPDDFRKWAADQIRSAVAAERERCVYKVREIECSCGPSGEMMCGRCYAINAIRKEPTDDEA